MRRVQTALEVFRESEAQFLRSDATDRERLRILAIYHASFGDVALGAAAAKQLLECTLRTGSIDERARDLMLAGAALRAAGMEDSAAAAFCDALTLSKKQQMYALAGGAALNLASLTYCMNELEASQQWLERAEEIADQAQDATLTANIRGLRVRRALNTGQFGELPKLFALLEDSSQHRPRRYEIINETARIRYQILSRSLRPERAILNRLLAMHSEFDRGIGSDYVVAAIGDYYEAAGDPRAAQRYVQQYLANERRERSSVPPEVQRFLTADANVAEQNKKNRNLG
jgi:hypothetical protein